MAAARAKPQGGMAVPSVLCLALAIVVVRAAAPHGLSLGGEPLPFPVEAALLGGAFVAGAWGAFAARERRVLLGSVLAALLLAPAADPRLPLDRLPLHALAAVLFLLHVEFALLNAKVARLAAMPRAHVSQVGRAREVELRQTANRIAGGWPVPLAVGLGLMGAMVAVQLALVAGAPSAPADSLEMRGPFGLALGAAVVLGAVGAAALRRRGQGDGGGEAGGAPR